ncbi:MAG: putative protein involved in signal transduction [Bacteroidetes bacterium]|jgi:L-methionine (R)-S-oxide reductase|nr:putative protein involved in signal transduction [Bacteroidota bacterium]
MAESLIKLTDCSKTEQYESLVRQLEALVGNEWDVIANMANISAAIKDVFGFLWVGFYIVKDDWLVLGPFQGSIACTRIARGRGVCGIAWQETRTLVVPDVNLFSGHIACSSLSKSEIVVPLVHQDKVWAVLDIDSSQPAHFDDVDAVYLNKIVGLISVV